MFSTFSKFPLLLDNTLKFGFFKLGRLGMAGIDPPPLLW